MAFGCGYLAVLGAHSQQRSQKHQFVKQEPVAQKRGIGVFLNPALPIGSSNLTSWTLPCSLSCFHNRSIRVAGIFLWQWLMFNIQEQWTGMYVFTLLFHQGLSFYSCLISVCFHFYYSLQFKQEKESCRNPRATWSFVCMLVEELGYLYVYLMVPVAETELFWP